MKLRVIYALTYGVYGFIIGFIVSFGLFALIAGVFWLFIFGDSPWPSWSFQLLNLLRVFTFAVFFIGSILLGIKRVKRLEGQENQDGIFRKALSGLIWAGIALVVFNVSIFVYSVREEKKNAFAHRQEQQIVALLKNHREIDHIDISQVENGVDIAVYVPGPAEGKFFLELKLKGAGYVKEQIMELSQIVEILLPKQSFHFLIPFNRLAESYREQLLNYVPFFEREFQIDEYISLDAVFKISDNDTFPQELIDSVEMPESKQSALLRFKFSCFKDICQIIQTDKDSEASHEEQNR